MGQLGAWHYDDGEERRTVAVYERAGVVTVEQQSSGPATELAFGEGTHVELVRFRESPELGAQDVATALDAAPASYVFVSAATDLLRERGISFERV